MPAWEKLQQRFENIRILVNHQLKLLVNQQKLQTETSKGIKSLIDTTEECLQQLKSLKVDTSSWDTLLIYILVQKLPFYTLKLWEEDQGANEKLPTLNEFKTFLNTRLKVLESIADVIGPKTTQVKPKGQTYEKTAAHISTKEGGCPVCGGRHFVQKCLKYKRMTLDAKRRAILAAGRCLNCLSSNHTQSNCTSKYKCFKCSQPHHTSLHQEFSSERNTPNYPSSKSISKDSTSSQADSIQEGNSHSAARLEVTQAFISLRNINALLSTALVVARSSQGETSTLRCLIDPGSQSSFLTEEACKRLAAPCTSTAVIVTVIGRKPADRSSQETILQLQPEHSNGPVIEETFYVIEDITDPLPKQPVSKKNLHHLHGLKLADPTFWKTGPIDALLGVNAYVQILQRGLIRGNKRTPSAINTIFGWIILGPTTTPSHKEAISLMATTENDLNCQLKQFFETEEFPSHPVIKKDELDCQTIFQITHKRTPNGQYQVTLPFVNNELPELGASHPQALTRFRALQTQLIRKPDLARDYTKCLDEYIQLDHMEMVSPILKNNPHYYIPHHAVFKDSTTTKLRVVFDASCKTTNGTSLNDHLLKGPTLQPKLFAILMKWRKHKVAITADIEKMYRMILVHPDQRAFQRIIWKHPITGEPQDYELKTVTFGTSSAPYLAVRTLQQLAEDERTNWPLASHVALKD